MPTASTSKTATVPSATRAIKSADPRGSARHTKLSDTRVLWLQTPAIHERIAAELTGVNTHDVLTIWSALAMYLADVLVRQAPTAVMVPRLGVFACQRGGRGAPRGDAVFYPNENFLRIHRLRDVGNKVAHRTGVPLPVRASMTTADAVAIDMAEIGHEYLQNCHADTVQAVVTQTMALISKEVKLGRDIRLSMHPLGDWECRGDAVAFTFTSDFLARLRCPQGNSTSKRRPTSRSRPDRVHDTPHEEAPVDSAKRSEERASCKAVSTPKREARIARHVAWMDNEQEEGVSASQNQRTPSESKAAVKAKIPDVVACVRAQLVQQRGDGALNDLHRSVLSLDVTREHGVTLRELMFAFRELQVQLSQQELKELAQTIGYDGALTDELGDKDLLIGVDELLSCLRRGCPLRPTCRQLIDSAFEKMDSARAGAVTIEAMRACYDPTHCALVRAGKKSKAEAMRDFDREWAALSGAYGPTNSITRAVFRQYYHNVSVCVPSDRDFELLMRRAWHVSLSNPRASPNDWSDDNKEGNAPKYVQQRTGGIGDGRHRASSDADGKTENHANPNRARYTDDHGRVKKMGTVRMSSSLLRANSVGNQHVNGRCDSGRGINDGEHAAKWRYLQALVLPRRPSVHAPHPSWDDMSRRLGANRVWGDESETINVRAFVNALCLLDKRLRANEKFHATSLAQLVLASCAPQNGSNRGQLDADAISLSMLYQKLSSLPHGFETIPNHDPSEVNADPPWTTGRGKQDTTPKRARERRGEQKPSSRTGKCSFARRNMFPGDTGCRDAHGSTLRSLLHADPAACGITGTYNDPSMAVRAQLQQEREQRERAARMIQTRFRGFRARKLVDCVRRCVASDAQRHLRDEQEANSARPRVARPAVKSYYGF